MKEALKLALEALERNDYLGYQANQKAIAAIKEALAQPKQEPVAHMYADDYERMLNSETFCTVYSVAVGSPTRGETTIELFTTPPQRKPLTEDQIQKIWDVAAGAIPGWSRHIAFARAIEAKLKEKNT